MAIGELSDDVEEDVHGVDELNCGSESRGSSTVSMQTKKRKLGPLGQSRKERPKSIYWSMAEDVGKISNSISERKTDTLRKEEVVSIVKDNIGERLRSTKQAILDI